MEEAIHMSNLTEIDIENLTENHIENLIEILMLLHIDRLHIEEIHMNLMWILMLNPMLSHMPVLMDSLHQRIGNQFHWLDKPY